MGPSIWQIVIVLLIVLLVFGTKRLRNVGSDLGAAIKSFRSGMIDGEHPGETDKLGRDGEPAARTERERQQDRQG